MKAQEQIYFLSDLLHIIQELQTLVQDYCRLVTAEQEECWLEDDGSKDENYPF